MHEPDPELATRILRVRIANTIALFDYTPEPYPASILFFRVVERRVVDDPSPEVHWPPLDQESVEILFVTGDHETKHDAPNVRAIARRLKRLREPFGRGHRTRNARAHAAVAAASELLGGALSRLAS